MHAKRAQVLTRIRVTHLTAAMFSMAAVVVPLMASASQLNDILVNIYATLTLLLRILMTLAFVVFIWGIVRFIAAAGNPQAIKQAKGIMYYGIIALAIMASMTGIIVFLQTYFGISGSGKINVPQF